MRWPSGLNRWEIQRLDPLDLSAGYAAVCERRHRMMMHSTSTQIAKSSANYPATVNVNSDTRPTI